MLISCIAPYTAPDGEVYENGKTYEVDEARSADLQSWAPGHFVIDARPVETQDIASVGSRGDGEPLVEPPADRQARPRRTR